MTEADVIGQLPISITTEGTIEQLTDADLGIAVLLLERMAPNSRSHLREAFFAIVLRAIETRILCDPRLRQLALYWDTLLGEADNIIRETIFDLTKCSASPELVRYVKNCVRSDSSRRGHKLEIPRSVVEIVIENAIATEGPEVRCHHCGYHFCLEDVGIDRQELICDLQGEFSSTIHPRRLQDLLKPWQVPTGGQKLPRRLTRLTIDHLTPEAGFGWTEPENLVVACEFCNNGRAVYRRGAESLSVVIAGSLQGCPSTREHNQLRQIAVVAAVIAARRRCSQCGVDTSECELTVRTDEELSGTRWLAPWAAKVLCYNCTTI
jgi:hypothetical protein